MFPLISPGDTAFVQFCRPENILPGDIALLLRWGKNGIPHYVTHRVLLNRVFLGRRVFISRGDANLLPDLPLFEFEPLGRITSLIKRGTRYQISRSFWPIKLIYAFCAAMARNLALGLTPRLFCLASRLTPGVLTLFKNYAWLKWETAAVPSLETALSYPVRTGLQRRPAAPAEQTELKTGTIFFDEIWTGKVTVRDRLLIPAGVTVSVRPGTEIVFETGGDRNFPLLRATRSGATNELNTPHTTIRVFGRLALNGNTDSPVILRGPSLGGLHAFGRGEMTLSRFRVEGARACALSASDAAFIECRDGFFSDCTRSLLLCGTAAGTVNNCSFKGGAGPVLHLLDNSFLSVSASSVSDASGSVFEISDAASAGLSGFSASGCERGGSLSSCAALMASDLRFREIKQSALELSGSACARAAGFYADDCFSALNLSGSSRATISGGRFTGNRHGISLGGRSVLRGTGLSFADNENYSCELSGRATAILRSFSSSGENTAVAARERAGLVISRGSLRNGRQPGISVSGSVRAGISRFTISSGWNAIHASGKCRLSLREVSVNEATPRGLYLGKEVTLSGKKLLYNGVQWVRPPAAQKPPGPGLRALFPFAAATYKLPFFSQLYRALYLAGPYVAQRVLSFPGVAALYLYRGMTGVGWVPALSDMDLACLFRKTDPEKDWDFYRRFMKRVNFLRAALPYAGEVMIAGRREFLEFMSCWGVKGREFYSSSRLLCGEPSPEAPRPAAAPEADLTEAFYAYTILGRHFFSRSKPRPFIRRNCLKNMVDVLRYLDGEAASRNSRAAYARSIGEDLDAYADFSGEEAAFRAFSALHSASRDRALRGSFSPGEAAEFTPLAAGRNPGKFDDACFALAAAGGGPSGFVMDSLYRFYMVLPDSAAGDRALFGKACSAVLTLGDKIPEQVPVILTAASFEQLSFTAYLNNPFFWHELLSGECRENAPADIAGSGIYMNGFRPARRQPKVNAGKVMPLLALRHFSATWRSFWENMPLHYFYSRAAGLRLFLDKGEISSFSRVRALSARFREIYGGGLFGWDEFCMRGFSRENYTFVAAQVEAALKALERPGAPTGSY